MEYKITKKVGDPMTEKQLEVLYNTQNWKLITILTRGKDLLYHFSRKNRKH